ncbi:hypothetical protein ZWY2020_052351 [Hordeum vulgare]|nr:hypothetical protein ZWY2020_052351 [Hordeum vulgare]
MASGASSSSQGEEEHHLPTGVKGTTTVPFDSGAFTLEVLAGAGKGERDGAAVEGASRGLEGEQRMAQLASIQEQAVVDGGKRGRAGATGGSEGGLTRRGSSPLCCARKQWR